MSWLQENRQIKLAFFKGVFVFLFFVGALLLSVLFYDFSNTNMNALAFILALVCIVFISKSVHEISIGSEITQRLAEELANKLIESPQQLFLEVYNNSPVAYLIVGQYGDIVSANPAAARLFGIASEKLIKRDVFSFLETSNEEHKSVIKQKFQQGIVVSDEEVKVVRGDNFSWTQASIFQFSGTDGKKLSLITFVDVTKQKEVEIAKSEFVSLASHQLRTPISGMRWSAELLLMDGVETLTKQQRRYIDRLLSSIERMSSLVDDFLQVSRFELGTRVLKQEAIILEEIFNDVVAEQTESATGKSLSIIKNYDASIKTINSDLGLVRMIVTNLYTNAVKYSRVGGEISLSYQRSGGDLVIEVKDSGMGIPFSEQHRVFSKIFRASNAIKEVPDGTGLGLYILKKAVLELQGRVTFTSTEDVGTTFTVVIPTSL